MQQMKMPVGKGLVAHMREKHGMGGWYDPKPNSREYKELQGEHARLYHGRWQDQQDHTHG